MFSRDVSLLGGWQEAHQIPRRRSWRRVGRALRCSAGGIGKEGEIYSARFNQAAKAPCEQFRAPEVRKCHLSVCYAGQDESVYKAYTRESTEWVIRGVRGLRKKTDGPG